DGVWGGGGRGASGGRGGSGPGGGSGEGARPRRLWRPLRSPWGGGGVVGGGGGGGGDVGEGGVGHEEGDGDSGVDRCGVCVGTGSPLSLRASLVAHTRPLAPFAPSALPHGTRCACWAQPAPRGEREPAPGHEEGDGCSGTRQ